jgi:serine/threonine protein kinase
LDYVPYTLCDVLGTDRPLPLHEARSVLYQLLQAVAHLHEHWLLHRDIKPSNVLLTAEGAVCLADFGFARPFGSPLRPYSPQTVTLWYRCGDCRCVAAADTAAGRPS